MKSKYAEEELIDAIRSVAEDGQTPTMEQYRKTRPGPSVSTIQNYFGSWNKAVKAAGFEPNKRGSSYTKEELLDWIGKLSNGENPPTAEEMNATEGAPAALTFAEKFGSWTEALAEAGYDRDVQRGLTKEDITDLIKELADDDTPPTSQEFHNHPKTPSQNVVRNRFGTWNEAVKAAGMEPRDSGAVMTHTKEDVIRNIQEMADGDEPPTSIDFHLAQGVPSTEVVNRLFGSWNNAVEAAGFEPRQQKRTYSKEEVITLLQKHADGDEPPKSTEFGDFEGTPSLMTVVNMFGSWNEAVKAAGLKARRSGSRYSSEELLDEIRKATDERGEVPTSKEFKNMEGKPSTKTVVKHFGSWEDAVEKAGLA